MRRLTTRLIVTGGLLASILFAVLAQPGPGDDREALARELRGAWLPLESGMTLSRSEGVPISAKYEIDDGTFQLSVYTLSGDRVSEVIVDYSAGTVAKVEALTDSADLAAAQGQRQAMAAATRSLEAATAAAVGANPGYRAVRATPRLNGGHPVAEIALVKGTDWRVVLERLD